jgi:hypothetical protein
MNSSLSVIAFGLAIAAVLSVGTMALFGDAPTVSGNVFATDTLNPPTAPASTGVLSTALSWTATTDTYASGHRVFRGTVSGGPYTQVGQVTPRTTTTFTESPSPGTYYYVLRSYVQNWESVNSSQVTALVSAQTGYQSCTANAAVTVNSGDNNGYQLNPANACANGAGFAEDTNSGTNTNTACNNTGKDRHLFYNYGLGIPGGASIRGIEVRLDAWSDSTVGAPRICVEISWDGGTSWTAGQITSNLTAAEVTYTLGGNTNTWGRTWATTDFANANFRIRVTSISTNTNRDHRIDWIPVQVTYTP